MNSEFFEKQIDDFIVNYLESVPDANKLQVQFILNQLRGQFLSIIAENDYGDPDANKINDLCAVIDDEVQFYDDSILEKLGIADLRKHVFETRRSIKWKLLVDELMKILSPDQPFSPAVIKRQSPDLFRAIEFVLKIESEDSRTVDWDKLIDRLPEEMRGLYQAEIIDCEEKRRIIDEETKKKIEKLGIEDAIAGLSGDPKKLAQFLDLSGLKLSELEKSRIIYISFAGLKSKTENKLNRLLKECDPILDSVEILSAVPTTTKKPSVNFKVTVPEGATHLLVRGPWNRDIKINGEREIEFDVILQPGKENEIQIIAYRYQQEDTKKGIPEIKLRSDLEVVHIRHIGEQINEDVLIEFLKSLRGKTLEDIQSDKERQKVFLRCLEESSIKHFAGNFEEGKRYMQNLIASQKSPFVVQLLQKVLRLFEKINTQDYPFVREGEDLLFFQKYCVYKINEKRANGQKNVILANEPGLGKTLTALAAVYDDEMLAICPNSAASTWIEQEAKFFNEPFILGLAGHPHRKRPNMIKERSLPGVLSNIEFIRTGESDKAAPLTKEYIRRFNALNARSFPGRHKVLVVDEFHFLKGESQQAWGVELLESDFALLMSASPYRSSSDLCRIYARIFPDDRRFKNMHAFEEAFPKNDPRALKSLYIMTQPYVIRFLKSEVMPTYDPNLPLEDQSLSLPAKKSIDPFDKEDGQGAFTLTNDQEGAILELFQDWKAWTEKYEHYMPKGKLAKDDGIRDGGNSLTKKHALRQIVNNPAYVGSSQESPKHKVAKEILKKELAGGNKVLIFCRYHNQVQIYAEILKEMGVRFAEFTGEKSAEGIKKDENGKYIKYLVDEFDNYVFDESGEPIVAKKGQPFKTMLAIDYERLSFQNNTDVKVCISTYSAGSQSVTFTAADVMIKDDLPEDYTESYQSEDRIHRVDDKRRKYEVRYYNLVSQYSQEFLDIMKKLDLEEQRSDGDVVTFNAYERWFENGTYDEVHYQNLDAQKTSFELLNNGIAIDPNIAESEQPFNFGN